MISTSTALRGGLTIQGSKSSTTIVGISGDNLNNIVSNHHTLIGSMPTLVAQDLAADLLSATPLVDRGCSIYLDAIKQTQGALRYIAMIADGKYGYVMFNHY